MIYERDSGRKTGLSNKRLQNRNKLPITIGKDMVLKHFNNVNREMGTHIDLETRRCRNNRIAGSANLT